MLCVIGAGNVVQGRLLQALKWHGIDLADIQVHGTWDDPPHLVVDDQHVYVIRHKAEELPQVAAQTELTVWLASPPYQARREFLVACLGKRYVCEKPLGMTLNDLQWLQENPKVLSEGFVLSYYVQEKLAPVLWLTGKLHVPRTLLDRGAVYFQEAQAGEVKAATMLLREELSRGNGEVVSAWQQKGGIGEFAVHAPAMFANLGLTVNSTSYGKGCVTFKGAQSVARVQRPGKLIRSIRVETSEGICLGDGVHRVASLLTRDGVFSAGIDSNCPPYSVVVAYALDWLRNNSSYSGDGAHQMTGLRALFEGAT